MRAGSRSTHALGSPVRRGLPIVLALAVAACAHRSTPSRAGAALVSRGDGATAWAALPAGTYTMGSDLAHLDLRPSHPVTLAAFELSATEVTVTQYRACVDAGACAAPGTEPGCTWAADAPDSLPVTCVPWGAARAYCAWAGGRLCSESEWEYAARSGGAPQRYPWGDETASCDYAVIKDNGHDGCGTGAPWPVGSKPAGTSAQGAADLAGNVWEWVEDCYQDSYGGAPADGSARSSCTTDGGSLRVVRGSSYEYMWSHYTLAVYRFRYDPAGSYRNVGIRCCR